MIQGPLSKQSQNKKANTISTDTRNLILLTQLIGRVRT